MVSKVFKVLLIISLLAVSAVLFYTYASLGETVRLGDGAPVFSRSGFFYTSLGIIVLFNFLAFPLMKILRTDLQKAWYSGFLICLHLFLSAIFIFTAILNSNEKYDYSRLGPAVYGSVILLCVWILLYPALLFYQRKGDARQD